MKRIGILIALLLCMMMAFSAQAVEAAPGDTVSIPISITNTTAQQITLRFSFDESIFEFVSMSGARGSVTYHYNGTKKFGTMLDVNGNFPIPSGQFGTVTLKIKDDAAAGTYGLSTTLVEAWDAELKAASVSISSGSVTIVVPCKHTKTEENVTKQPGCETTGTKEIICSECKEVLRTESIDALGHAFGDFVVTTPATCEKDGVETSTCANCGNTKTQPVNKLGHAFGDFVVTTPATCEKDGVETSKCSRCDETQTKAITKLGHAFGDFEVTTPATCEKDGVETSKCSRCDETQTKAITKLGHDFEDYKETKAPTCTEEGTRTGYCVRCDQTATETIPSLGHDMSGFEVTVKPTCTEKGKETSKCSRCDEVKTNDIPALNHDFGAYEVTTPATCLVAGVETSKCSRCDEVKTRAINALNHNFGEYTVTKPATCTEKGTETAACSRCDEVKTREIKALGHSFGAYTVTKPATCTEKGVETSACSRCDEVKTREIKALGHAFSAWTAEVTATCTEAGKETRKCSRCNETEERTIAALGHNAVWKIIKPATRTEEGLRQKICKRCNEVLDEQIIPIRKHAYKTACTAGLRVDEIAQITDSVDAWKMLTPIDVTVQGTTRYPLIAGNVYEIGYVEVTIDEEMMNVEIVVEAKVAMYDTALVFLTNAEEFERFSVNDYEHYEFPASIKLADLPADKLLMMVTCQLTIDEARPEPKYYNFKGEEHALYMEQLTALYEEYFVAEEAAE